MELDARGSIGNVFRQEKQDALQSIDHEAQESEIGARMKQEAGQGLGDIANVRVSSLKGCVHQET